MAPVLNIQPSPISESSRKSRLQILDKVEAEFAKGIPWYDFPTPAEYRQARREGTHGLAKPESNPRARSVRFTARDGHQVELRVIAPETRPTRGCWLHFHAGGFVIGSNASYDTYLTRLSEGLGLTLASVEYRLAPEFPYPAAQNDAVDAALYALSDDGARELGAPLRVLGGESAGGYLSVSVALALRDEHGIDVRTKIVAVCAGYGIFDLTYTPSLLSHQRAVFLSKEDMSRFVEAAFAHIPLADRKQPKISPLYADLQNLPPAHFMVGTVEPLLDDSIFMALKWQQAGNEADLDVVEGGFHAFTLYNFGDVTEEGLQKVMAFVGRHLQ